MGGLPWACVVAGGQGGTQLKGGESLLSDLSFHTKKSRRSNHGISLLGERLLWSTDSWEGLKNKTEKVFAPFLEDYVGLHDLGGVRQLPTDSCVQLHPVLSSSLLGSARPEADP